MEFKYNDGGRQLAGYKGDTSDCVVRSIAIAANLPYQNVYNRLSLGNAAQRKSKRCIKRGKTAAHGIITIRKWFKEYMKSLGFNWVPCMKIGQGCMVHLTDGELPLGRLVVALSKHYTAVIDNVINDTYSPERNIEWIKGDGSIYIQKRCVYGYFILLT